jgi:hypothetical protein
LPNGLQDEVYTAPFDPFERLEDTLIHYASIASDQDELELPSLQTSNSIEVPRVLYNPYELLSDASDGSDQEPEEEEKR